MPTRWMVVTWFMSWRALFAFCVWFSVRAFHAGAPSWFVNAFAFPMSICFRAMRAAGWSGLDATTSKSE